MIDNREVARFRRIGSHLCDLLEWVTGQRITSLVAELDTVTPRRPIGNSHTFVAASGAEDEQNSAVLKMDVNTEDIACVMFRMSEGALGTLTVSQVSAGRKNAIRLALDGSSASLVFDGTTPDRLCFGRLEENSEFGPPPFLLLLPNGSARCRRHALGFLDSSTALFTDVYAAI